MYRKTEATQRQLNLGEKKMYVRVVNSSTNPLTQVTEVTNRGDGKKAWGGGRNRILHSSQHIKYLFYVRYLQKRREKNLFSCL